MGLLDEVAKEAVAHKPTHCIVGRWLNNLEQKTRAEVSEVLASSYPFSAMYRVISRHYPKVFAERSLTKHLEGQCCCVPER